MSRQIINETFPLRIPDSFTVMSESDLRDLSKNGGDPFGWGVRDQDRHLIITALWKRYPAWLAWIADLKSIAKKNEQLTAGAYAGHSYRLHEFFSLQAGEEKAEGFRYSYRAGDVIQAVDCYLVKEGKTVYAFLCGGREENAAADRALFREVMESLEYA